MNIKRNIIFSPESRKKDGVVIEDNVPIRMRVVFGGQRVDFSTGYRIDVSKWNPDKQRVKNGCTNKLKQSSADINNELDRLSIIIQNIFKEFEVNETMPSPKELREAFNKKVKTEEPVSEEDIAKAQNKVFWDAFEEFNREGVKLNNWALGTVKKIKVMKNHLTEFDSDATFEGMTDEWFNDYIVWLRDDKDMRNSTIEKQINLVKWFLRWATQKGYNKNLSFTMFKPKLKTAQKNVIFLTPEEIEQIESCKIPATQQYLERVRDMLIFCCYTGLRHSDLYNLRRSDIKPDHIEVTTVKTSDALIIELNSHSRTILEKYKDVHFADGKALPVISNQKMNSFLKDLCELAELNTPVRETYYKGGERIDIVLPKHRLICTHTGRRSFICNALALGISPEVVMKWTGHSDYSAMKPYIAVADKLKRESMKKFDLK